MNEFIQHMNTLPLHHEPEFPFMRHSFLADFYSTFHKTYTQLDTNKIEYSIVKNKSATLARIHRDLKAITNEIKEYTLKHVIHDLQAHYHNNEVSSIKWLSYEECLQHIRPYNLEKKQIITKINYILNNYKLY